MFLGTIFQTISAISNLLLQKSPLFQRASIRLIICPSSSPPNSGVWLQGSYHRLLDLHPLATFCPRVRGRGGPEDIVSHNCKLVHCNLISSAPLPSTFVASTQSHLAYFCTPPAEATALLQGSSPHSCDLSRCTLEDTKLTNSTTLQNL